MLLSGLVPAVAAVVLALVIAQRGDLKLALHGHRGLHLVSIEAR